MRIPWFRVGVGAKSGTLELEKLGASGAGEKGGDVELWLRGK